jgi:hypothetical protein
LRADYLVSVHPDPSCRPRLRARSARIGIALSACVSACGLGGPPETPDARIRRDTRIVHEECDTDGPGSQARDVDGDGRSDLRIAFRGKQEFCRSIDLNYDGRVDTWVYKAPDGSVRRRESDYDRDGRIDEISIYKRTMNYKNLRITS